MNGKTYSMGRMKVTNIQQTGIALFQNWKKKLSKTDLKVYSFVVLGNLLIAFAVAMACAFPYISMAHPLLGALSPALLLTAGAFSLEQSKKHHHVHAAVPVNIEKPRGLYNKGANCWLNASAQLLFNLPAFKNIFERNVNKTGLQTWFNKNVFSNDPLLPVTSFYQQYQKGEKVDSQDLRLWLNQRNKTISKNPSSDEDPIYFLKEFFKLSSHHLPIEIEEQIRSKKGEISSISSRISDARDPSYFFDLTPYLDGEISSLEETLEKYFHSSGKLSEGKEEMLRFMMSPPDDISVVIGQADELGGKKDNPLKEVLEFTLTEKQVGEEASYQCDGFICHVGSSSQSGHYIAFFKKDTVWWRVSDENVSEVTFEQVKKVAPKAYFLHYAKVY